MSICNKVVTPELKQNLHVSEKSINNLYCLPKTHKQTKTLRLFNHAVVYPTYDLAE